MEIEQAMNMTLDDLINAGTGTKPARNGTRKPRKSVSGKAKVAVARALGQGTQKGSAGKQPARQNGRQVLGVQKKSLKPAGGVKRTVVTVTNSAAKRKVSTGRGAKVAVTIRNTQVARPLQARLGRPVTRAAGLANQVAPQAPPKYGYGPRNLLPRSDYGGAAPPAAPAPLAPTPLRRQSQRGAGGGAGSSSDFGVSRRVLGESLALARQAAPIRRRSQFVDYDNTATGLRMDYGL